MLLGGSMDLFQQTENLVPWVLACEEAFGLRPNRPYTRPATRQTSVVAMGQPQSLGVPGR
jgi:hypothetical protein